MDDRESKAMHLTSCILTDGRDTGNTVYEGCSKTMGRSVCAAKPIPCATYPLKVV